MISLLAIFVLLVGPSVVMVQAAFVPTAMVTQTQSFARDDNDHAYVYAKDDAKNFPVDTFLNHEEDVDYVRYDYARTYWNRQTGSYPGPADRQFYIGSGYGASWGWLQESKGLPAFYEFVTEHNDTAISESEVYNIFPLELNSEYSLFAESGYSYIGTFNVTDQEFFHMTVTSHQDGLECGFGIIDYQGRWLAEGYIDDSDIVVMPFKSSGNGTYFFYFEFYASDPADVIFDFLIEPVVPEVIAFGDIVEGTLPGSEIKFDTENDNSWVYEQMRPNVHTYKFSSNSTQFGKLSVLFENLGGLFLPTNIRADIIGCLFGYDYTFWQEMDLPSDVFYYTSFANETYYLTIQGMDNVGFTVINQMVDIPALPRNEEFFIQNWQADRIVKPYRLTLGQDSVLRINRTEWNGGFQWNFMTYGSDGYYKTYNVPEGSSFEGASTIYLPAGKYLITARSEGSSASGLYEFNFGPVLNGAGPVSVDVDRIIGMKVPVEDLMFYRSNVTLMTQDNVTVNVDIDYLNMYGGSVYTTNHQLGNRQSGTSWMGYASNTSTHVLGVSGTSYSMFCDGYAIIAVAPYRIRNNTNGVAEDLFGRTVDFDVTFDEDGDGIVTEFVTTDLGSGFSWSNFSLWTYGDNNEYYALHLTGAEGVWMNISLLMDQTELNDMWIYAYQDIDGCPQRLNWDYLDDNFLGDLYNGSFELGGISNDILLVFNVMRYLNVNTTLSIGIDPLTVNELVYLPVPTYYGYGSVPGQVVGIDPALAIVGVGIIAVVVVVVVVVLKKRGTI
ncbi:MAG: hypothetical protein ACFFF4_08845 [Candidatus Thorarchaeota archaeon]